MNKTNPVDLRLHWYYEALQKPVPKTWLGKRIRTFELVALYVLPIVKEWHLAAPEDAMEVLDAARAGLIKRIAECVTS